MNKLLKAQLIENIAIEQKLAQQHIKQVKQIRNSPMRRGPVFSIFDKYEQKYFNIKFISNIAGLYALIKDNNLEVEDVKKFIVDNKLKFSFLNHLITVMPNSVDDLMQYGPIVVAENYAKALQIQDKDLVKSC